MQKIVSIINPLTEPRWNEMVLQWEESTIFHSVNWAKLLVDCYGYEPRYFTIIQKGKLRACIPVMEVDSHLTGRRGVSLTFSDYCSPLLDENEDFDLLYNALLEFGRMRHWNYAELRGVNLLERETAVKQYVHDVVNLSPDEDMMRQRLKESTARNVRKAVKEGVQTSFSWSLESVHHFYQMHCLTRKRHGVPPQPIAFFEKLHKHVISNGFGFTALAQIDKRIIAGLICLTFGPQAIYKYGASDTKFQNLRANNLLLWTTMVKCAKEGCSEMSLGRTDMENQGLLAFKNGWGGKRTTLKYHRYNFSSGGYTGEPKWNSNIYKYLLRMLPMKSLTKIGKLIYPHLG